MKKFFAMLTFVAILGALSFGATGCDSGKKTPTTPTKSATTAATDTPKTATDAPKTATDTPKTPTK